MRLRSLWFCSLYFCSLYFRPLYTVIIGYFQYLFLHLQDLTEVERQVCEQTAHFEDFVMLFLDKVLILIENYNGGEATRADAAAWGKYIHIFETYMHCTLWKSQRGF